MSHDPPSFGPHRLAPDSAEPATGASRREHSRVRPATTSAGTDFSSTRGRGRNPAVGESSKVGDARTVPDRAGTSNVRSGRCPPVAQVVIHHNHRPASLRKRCDDNAIPLSTPARFGVARPRPPSAKTLRNCAGACHSRVGSTRSAPMSASAPPRPASSRGRGRSCEAGFSQRIAVDRRTGTPVFGGHARAHRACTRAAATVSCHRNGTYPGATNASMR